MSVTVGPSAAFHERSLTIVSTEPSSFVISSRAIIRGVTAAPALGSMLAVGLPEPVTVAPAACAWSSAGLNVMPVPSAPAVPIAVIVRDSSRSPPSPVSMLIVPPTW